MSPRVCLRGLIDRSAHLHLRSGARDPPDLDAIFRRVPVLATRFLSRAASLGDVQRSPLHRSSRGVRLPDGFGFALPLLLICPSGWKCRFPSAFRPRGFSPPRRFLLHDPATVFQAAADPGVHRVSFRLRNGLLAMHLLPFEAFPPPTAARAAETNLRFCAGSRHWLDLDTCVPSTAPFTANLAPSSLPPSPPLTVSRCAPR